MNDLYGSWCVLKLYLQVNVHKQEIPQLAHCDYFILQYNGEIQ